MTAGEITAQVAILGAGPAGLSAALALSRAGREVAVVERAAQVGGLARTVTHDGFRFDLGGHRFFTKNAAVAALVRELLGADLLEVARLSTIHFRNRYVGYPIRPLNALANVGPWTSLRILADLLRIAVRRRPDRPASLEEWMTASYGRTLYETYFKVYAEKVWGMPAGRISGELAAQRVKGLDLVDTIRDSLRRRRAGEAGSMVERFWYPRLGFGQISEAMAREMNGRILLEARPERVIHDRSRIRSVVLVDRAGQRSEIRPEHLVSSIPITTLIRLLDPPPPAGVQEAAAALGWRAVVFVAVFVDRGSIRPESWIYFPSPSISFGRTTEPRNWSPAMAPAGQTSVVAEHFCDVGDATWSASDEAIAERTLDDMTGPLGWFRRKDVLGHAVVRAPCAYPRMDRDHRQSCRVLEHYLDGFADLQLIGRAGMFRYHNTDHVIETGLAAASRILGDASVDPRDVNTELSYHEERSARCSRASC